MNFRFRDSASLTKKVKSVVGYSEKKVFRGDRVKRVVHSSLSFRRAKEMHLFLLLLLLPSKKPEENDFEICDEGVDVEADRKEVVRGIEIDRTVKDAGVDDEDGDARRKDEEDEGRDDEGDWGDCCWEMDEGRLEGNE